MPNGKARWFDLLVSRALPSADLSFWSSGFPCLFNRPRNCEAQSGLNLSEMKKGTSYDRQ